MRIAVTAGYWRSKAAIALLCELTRRKHQVSLCLVASSFNVGRVQYYARTYKSDLVRLVIQRLWNGAKPPEKQSEEMRRVAQYLQDNGWHYNSVKAAARVTGTDVLTVDDVNSPRAVAALRQAKPDLLVYSGGGILRKQLLEIPSGGTLNAHSGHLPDVRGMNAVEWSVLLGVELGVTVHFIDPGIDTGPIVAFVPMKRSNGESIATLRGAAILTGVVGLCDVIDHIANGSSTRLPQRSDGGKQYFIMHPRLKNVVEAKLRNETILATS